MALLASASASARPPSSSPAPMPEQVELSYSAGPRCPSKTAFVREVAARIRRPVEWVAGAGATRIVVTLVEAQEHATGELQVVRNSAQPTRREFVASSCAEVSSALALVTALTLDPNARTDQFPALAGPAEPEPDPVGAATEPATPAPAPAPPPAVPSPASPRPPSAASAVRVLKAPRYVLWLGPTAGVLGGYAPEPLITVGGSIGVRAADRRGFWPSLQLTPLWGKTGTTGPSALAAEFSWAMARVEACPAHVELAAPLALGACLAGEAGRLSARGAESQIDQPVSVDRWWLAAGLAASLHFSIGRWFTRLETHLLFPATRDQFVFRDPDRTVHQAGSVVYGSSLALGIVFEK